MVDIIADCPGALGMFWRYKWAVEQHQVNYDQIDMICFEASCDYDEIPFANWDGCVYSQEKYRKKAKHIYDDVTKDKNYVIN